MAQPKLNVLYPDYTYAPIEYDGIDNLLPCQMLTPKGWVDRTRETAPYQLKQKMPDGSWRFVSWFGPNYSTPDMYNSAETRPVGNLVTPHNSGGLPWTPDTMADVSKPFHRANGFVYSTAPAGGASDFFADGTNSQAFSPGLGPGEDPALDPGPGDLTWFYEPPNDKRMLMSVITAYIYAASINLTPDSTILSIGYASTLDDTPGTYVQFKYVSPGLYGILCGPYGGNRLLTTTTTIGSYLRIRLIAYHTDIDNPWWNSTAAEALLSQRIDGNTLTQSSVVSSVPPVTSTAHYLTLSVGHSYPWEWMDIAEVSASIYLGDML